MKSKNSPVHRAFVALRLGFVGVAMISLVINILMLTGPLFMMQVYDRVLASGSIPTLLVLGSLVAALYCFYGLLEAIRGRILARLAQRVDAQLSRLVYGISNELPVTIGRRAAHVRPVVELDTIRQFLSGPGPTAIFDLPWLPFYLVIVYLFHPVLGLVAAGGGLLICLLIALNEAVSRRPVEEAVKYNALRSSDVEAGQRNSEVIHAMGMQPALSSRWEAANVLFQRSQRVALDWAGFYGNLTKTLRFVLQSAILGTGAWLAIEHEISAGVMIAASIMTSRALSPIEQAVANWRGFVACRQSVSRLTKLLERPNLEKSYSLPLPLPNKTVTVEALYCGPFGEPNPTLQGISFALSAGEGLGVIGSSGAGKTTLARALVGALAPLKGAVRFDGAELSQWSEDRRGEIIGYLPQDVQLFDGSIAENIGRFRKDADPVEIIEAAQIADIHDLIVSLPEGYDTIIGRSGRILSAGQRQRIALARALFGTPFLLVLDEPNSNLDSGGEVALTQAIKTMKDKGSVVIVIAHRPSAIVAADKILCLQDGRMTAFGLKEEVLKKVLAPVPAKQEVM
ncbi:type I secretion system permease/ATPase [Roseibium suaedae]|uniref:ATP-binding cassette, subfamily C n=1 Tax=Roseibium suaedae TaxID=735517 RepID=A0A1M6YXI1_9HYPH|nr:type I secretion system permease/ATPase [Roseibium suaedae]SHL22772.1 ATP-binding cassette, subfamily C [Roseibium suaedae]